MSDIRIELQWDGRTHRFDGVPEALTAIGLDVGEISLDGKKMLARLRERGFALVECWKQIDGDQFVGMVLRSKKIARQGSQLWYGMLRNANIDVRTARRAISRAYNLPMADESPKKGTKSNTVVAPANAGGQTSSVQASTGTALPPPFDHGQEEPEIGEDDDWLANSVEDLKAAGIELDDLSDDAPGGAAGGMQAAGSARPVERVEGAGGAGGDFRFEISDLKRGAEVRAGAVGAGDGAPRTGGAGPRTAGAVSVPRGRDIPGQMSMADLYRKTRDWFEIGTRRVDAGSMTAAQAAAVCRAMEEIFGAEGGEE